MSEQKQQRTVTIKIMHLVTITALVTRDSEDDEWDVEDVVSSQADVTPASLGETLTSDEWSHLKQLADAAPDGPAWLVRRSAVTARAAEDAVAVGADWVDYRVAQELRFMEPQYRTADAASKASLRSIILHRVAKYDLDRLPPELKGFVFAIHEDESQWRTEASRLEYDGPIPCERLSSDDLRAYAAAEPGGEASRWYVDGAASAVEVLYYANTRRGGVTAGANAVWTDADDARDAVVRVCLTGEVVP